MAIAVRDGSSSEEAARMAAVRRYDILDTPPDGAFDRITALAARLLDVPIAIVSVVDEDRIWFKSHHGLAVEEIDREPGLCASAIWHRDPWIIADARTDPRAMANPLVAGEFGLQFYAGVPLRTSDDHSLGTLCVLDLEPRTLTDAETATLRDLADLVMSELEFRLAGRRALAESAEREELKDAFLGMLSHELRTPLTTIYAATQMLAKDPAVLEAGRAADLVPDIVTEAERMLRLIDDLMVLSRLEQGRLETDREPILLQRVLPKAVEIEHRRWPGRSIELDLASGLPPIAADQSYVEQVVLNLLSNALKYSSETDSVDLSARVRGSTVEVRVRDHGIGIPPEDQESVFGLMFRTPTAMALAPGAGVGLYVCRRLLEAMGGTIRVESAPGVGTMFVIGLPIAEG
jgi:signal transduction histidine kinase